MKCTKCKLDKAPGDFWKNQKHCKDCQKAYHRNDPNRAYNGWVRQIKRRFGMTPTDYQAMLDDQGGVCKLCSASPEDNGKRLAVDHCHTTGKVRGLLCDMCNKGLGHFRDDVYVLRMAINYLKQGA